MRALYSATASRAGSRLTSLRVSLHSDERQTDVSSGPSVPPSSRAIFQTGEITAGRPKYVRVYLVRRTFAFRFDFSRSERGADVCVHLPARLFRVLCRSHPETRYEDGECKFEKLKRETPGEAARMLEAFAFEILAVLNLVSRVSSVSRNFLEARRTFNFHPPRISLRRAALSIDKRHTFAVRQKVSLADRVSLSQRGVGVF